MCFDEMMNDALQLYTDDSHVYVNSNGGCFLPFFLLYCKSGEKKNNMKWTQNTLIRRIMFPPKGPVCFFPFFWAGGYFWDWLAGRWFVDMNQGLGSTKRANEAT